MEDKQTPVKPVSGKGKTAFQKKLSALWQDNRSYKRRLLSAFLASLAFVFLFFVFGPLEIYFSNITFFTFSPRHLIVPVAVTALIILAVLTGLISLLKGKIFNYFVSFVFSLAVGCYLQGNLFNINHGSLDGTAIVWQNFKVGALLGLLGWIVIFLIPVVIQYFSSKIWRYTVNIVSGILVAMHVIPLAVLVITTINTGAIKGGVGDYGYLNRNGIYEVSDKKNVVVFLLDRFDKRYADEQIKRADDVVTEGLKGFTYYANFTGTYTYTFPSVTHLLTGVKTDYTLPPSEYFEKAWSEGTFLTDIRNAGYHSRIYSEINYIAGTSDNMEGKAENISSPPEHIPADKILTPIYGLTAFRYLPETLKPFFHTYTGDISYSYIYGDSEGNVPFGLDDVRFRADLLKEGLTVSSDGNGNFLFYHLHGAHDPFKMDKDGNAASGKGCFEQVRGNFGTIFAYCDMLKEKGLYDDTTIIITADHGFTGSYVELDYARNPALFIKLAGADVTKPLARSMKQINQDNLRASISSYFGLTDENGVDSLGNRTIESIGEDEEITRYFYASARNLKKGGMRDYNLLTYEIKGDANIFENWTLIKKEKIKCPYYDANAIGR